MTTRHAVLWIDPDSAQLRQFDAEHVEVDTVRPPDEGPQGMNARHAYFDEVCETLEGIREILVAGLEPTLSAFRHHALVYHPSIAQHLVAFEAMEPLSENQLLAHAREFFAQHDLPEESLPTA